MACLFTTGITSTNNACSAAFGGLLKVYLGNKSELLSVHKNPSTDQITGITMSASAHAYEFQFEDTIGAGLNEELQADSGGFIKQTIVFSLENLNQAKVQVLGKFKKGRLFAIIQYPDSTYKLVGETGFGLVAKTLSIQSGQKQTDVSKADLSLEASVLDYADEVTSTAISSIIL